MWFSSSSIDIAWATEPVHSLMSYFPTQLLLPPECDTGSGTRSAPFTPLWPAAVVAMTQPSTAQPPPSLPYPATGDREPGPCVSTEIMRSVNSIRRHGVPRAKRWSLQEGDFQNRSSHCPFLGAVNEDQSWALILRKTVSICLPHGSFRRHCVTAINDWLDIMETRTSQPLSVF